MKKNPLFSLFFLVFMSLSIFFNFGCSQRQQTASIQNAGNQQASEKPDMLAKKVNIEKAAKLNVELGLAYIHSNQSARGKAKLQRALALAPFLPDVHVAFGRYYESIFETEEAEKSYLKAIKINKNWAVSQNLYGTFLCRQGKYEQANKAFSKALEDKTYPDSAAILENAGLCELAAGHKEKAREYFEKALHQDIQRSNSLLELAYIHYEQKRNEIAEQLYHRYVMTARQTPRSLYLGVHLARVAKQKDKEASYLLLLKSEYPDSIEYQKIKQSF